MGKRLGDRKGQMSLPVSQICALIVFASTWMLLVVNSTPMVDFDSKLNSFLVKRETRLDFPTPESPIRTTRRIQRDTSARRGKVSSGLIFFVFLYRRLRFQSWCRLAILLLSLKKMMVSHGPDRRALIEDNWAVPPSSVLCCRCTFFLRFLRDPMSLLVFTCSNRKKKDCSDGHRCLVCSLVASILALDISRGNTAPLIIFEPLLFFFGAREGRADWQGEC